MFVLEKIHIGSGFFHVWVQTNQNRSLLVRISVSHN